jgi:hypothetical protein
MIGDVPLGYDFDPVDKIWVIERAKYYGKVTMYDTDTWIRALSMLAKMPNRDTLAENVARAGGLYRPDALVSMMVNIETVTTWQELPSVPLSLLARAWCFVRRWPLSCLGAFLLILTSVLLVVFW